MSLRIPVDASQNVQNAFRDVEQEIEDLKRLLADRGGDSSVDVAELKDQVDKMKTPPDMRSDRHVFVASGTQHSVGLVPDPGAQASSDQVLREDGTWGAPNLLKLAAADQSAAGVADIYTLPGSLHVSGELSAGQVTLAKIHQMDPVFCRLTKSGNTTQGTAAQFNAVLWNTESFDSEGMHSTASNTSRITIVTPGLYIISASLTVQQAAESKHVNIYKNGATVASSGGWVGGNTTTDALSVSYQDFAVAGDYYEVFTRFQSTDLTVNTPSWFAAVKVA